MRSAHDEAGTGCSVLWLELCLLDSLEKSRRLSTVDATTMAAPRVPGGNLCRAARLVQAMI